MVVDRVDAALVLASTLVATGTSSLSPLTRYSSLIFPFLGLLNIQFGNTDDGYMRMLLWSANGLAQAFAWPAVSTILVREFSKEERGRYWSLVSMSQNLGPPFLCVFSLSRSHILTLRPGFLRLLSPFSLSFV